MSTATLPEVEYQTQEEREEQEEGRTRRSIDPESRQIDHLVTILKKMSGPAQFRVVEYLRSRFASTP